jgi:hypothetical protein
MVMRDRDPEQNRADNEKVGTNSVVVPSPSNSTAQQLSTLLLLIILSFRLKVPTLFLEKSAAAIPVK